MRKLSEERIANGKAVSSFVFQIAGIAWGKNISNNVVYYSVIEELLTHGIIKIISYTEAFKPL